MSTPNIRFKGFNDDWQSRKLSDIANKAVDNRGKTPPISDEGTHPLIEVASLGNGAPDYTKVTKYLDDETFNKALRDYIKEGDILFSTVGSIGLVSLMDSREEAAIAQNIVSFRARENYGAKYLYAMFSNGDNQDKAWRIVMNGVQPSIKVSQLINVEYCVTDNLDEQKKIGEFFFTIDNLITLHQRKCDDLKDVKKYMLQKMFPQNGAKVPEIRFAGFTGEWKKRKVGEVTKELSEYATINSGLPLLTSSRLGILYQSDYRGNVTTQNEDTLFSVVPLNTCTYRHMSDDDTFHLNINTLEKGLVSREYPVFTAHNSNLNFIVQNINSNALFIKFCKEQKKGGTRTRLYYKNLCEFELLVPSIEEQDKIENFLLSLDNLVASHQKKCEELRELKKFMLQNMFPQK